MREDMGPFQRFVDSSTRKKMVEWCEKSLEFPQPRLLMTTDNILFRHALHNGWLKYLDREHYGNQKWVKPTLLGYDIASDFLMNIVK